MSTVATQAFFLALSALVSIVNPIGSALIFAQITGHRSHAERTFLARRIAIYAALIMVGALWIGSPLLAFFGVSLPALRVAGGIVVAASAWTLLNAPEHSEAQRETQAASAETAAETTADVAFFPLTLPFTTGPGTISVAIALSSNGPASGPEFASFMAASTAAALTVAACICLAYTWADKLVALLGRAGARVVTRLSAFLLLCVGVEIVLNGISGFIRDLH